jgi:TRAP-type uncharacterized transport system substrate-binding protein
MWGAKKMVRRWIALTAVLVAVLVGAAATWLHFFQLPPHKIVMATGSMSLAYYNFGQSYAEALRREGVEVEVQSTRGSVDNLDRLRDPDPRKRANVALVQGGIINANNAADLESLGTVFYEPLWFFRKRTAANVEPSIPRRLTTRTQAKACQRGRHGVVHRATHLGPPQGGLNSLRGKTIAVGPNGSGIQPLVCELLRRHGITWRVSDIRPLATADAVAGLLSGDVDAMFLVAFWTAPDVQRLLHDERVELADYPQADAYADLYPYLHKVVLHRGASDLANDQPPADVALISTKASLIVRKDLHPAIQYLLLNAARQIHAKQSILQEANEFPAAEAVSVPLSAAAQQFYKPGVPYFLNNFLKNYLPFWVAERINALLLPVLILVGTLGFLMPFIRPVPVLFNWMIQRPIFRLLVEMMALEEELESPTGKQNAAKISLRLDELEQHANRLLPRLPVAFAGMLLILRQRIDAMRERLEHYAAEKGPD